MSEWWTYRPGDLLLFSERVYWRLFELLNQTLWPWPVAALLLGAAIPFLARLRPQEAGRFAAAVLAIGWIVAGWGFLWHQYRPVNWAAAYAVPFFALQAALLVLLGVFRNAISFRSGRNAGVVLGWSLFLYALALHPLATLIAGRTIRGAELFAVAPDPTAIATLGLVLAARPSPDRFWLLAIPMIWCILNWITLATIGTWEAWLPLGATACSLAGLWMNRGPAGPGRSPHIR